MAQRVEVLLVDDIDDTEADETVTFALDGVSYEIDLNSSHATELREQLQIWTSAGRRTGGRNSSKTRPKSSSAKDRNAIREWARANGHPIGDKGRIAASIQEAYAAAHN